MQSRVSLDLRIFGWLVEVMPLELWLESLPGETQEEAAARLDAAEDIWAELLAEASASGGAA